MKSLFFITGNEGKLLEAKMKFSDLNIDIIQKDVGYPEIQTDTLEEVALFGAEHIQKKLNQPFILEDAGLFIDSLNGFPGVYSAYVFYKIGCSGILTLLKEKKDNERNATFKSVYAYCESGKKTKLFVGECSGIISKNSKGDHGFGYDPIFIPNGEIRTFAQMGPEEKNMFSHRGKSLDKVKNFIKNIKIESFKSN